MYIFGEGWNYVSHGMRGVIFPVLNCLGKFVNLSRQFVWVVHGPVDTGAVHLMTPVSAAVAPTTPHRKEEAGAREGGWN